MFYLDCALNLPLNQTFTYSYSGEDGEIFIGSHVLVPFGARRLNALVVSISKDLPSNLPKEKIRSIKRIIDKEPIFPNSLLSLSFWMKDYYVSTLGETIFTMLPSAKRESSSVSFSFDSDFSFTKSLSLSEEQKKAISDILTRKKFFIIFMERQVVARRKSFCKSLKKF